jgi:transposase
VLGLYEPARKIGVAVVVSDRKSSTLIPLIQQYVLPGTRIYTDEWRGYLPLHQPPFPLAYIHETVNHSRWFRDENTGVHTNNVEAFWSSIKAKFKRMNGSLKSLTTSFLNEYMYRKRFFIGDADFVEIFLLDYSAMDL